MTDTKMVSVPLEQLNQWRRDLDACQRVIWLAGGFDPAYCKDAQACLVQMDAALAAPTDTGAALAHARQEAINAKGIAGMCVKALTQAEGFVSATNRKAWGSDEGIGSTLPMIRDTLQRAKIFGKGNPQ